MRKVIFWTVAIFTLPIQLLVLVLSTVLSVLNTRIELTMNTFCGWAYQHQDVAEAINESIKRRNS